MPAKKKPSSDRAPARPYTIKNPPPPVGEPETPRAIADRSALRILRERGRELARIQQARSLRTFDSPAEIAADVYGEALDAIALERYAARIDVNNARAAVDAKGDQS